VKTRSEAPKTGAELRDWLVELFPEFIHAFDDPYNSPPDFDYTPHRVCSEFTSYYLERISDFASPQLVELFGVTELIAAADPHDADPVANALLTCFLENISGTDQGHAGRALMGPRSLRFFDGWHYPYLDRRGLPRHG
jgi:hypothetical protein